MKTETTYVHSRTVYKNDIGLYLTLLPVENEQQVQNEEYQEEQTNE